ncbi:hypothetical protein ACQJBY_009459 [Aegilops geniculata]
MPPSPPPSPMLDPGAAPPPPSSWLELGTAPPATFSPAGARRRPAPHLLPVWLMAPPRPPPSSRLAPGAAPCFQPPLPPPPASTVPPATAAPCFQPPPPLPFRLLSLVDQPRCRATRSRSRGRRRPWPSRCGTAP